jgi:thymidylate synthase (FAD)
MHHARIVAVTKPVNLNPDCYTADEFIAYAARVSNPANQANKETASKLIKYLRKNNHWSPFEMAHAVMEITTTRDIARQILRHRSFSFQEFSQRYADPTQDLGFIEKEARLQDTKNRQNSIDSEDVSLKNTWSVIQKKCIEQTLIDYKWAIDHGIAKEQARAILPEGLTVSRMYMAGSVRSWIHYCQLRMSNGTQREHRDVAASAWYELVREFPSLKDSLAD